MCWRLWLFACAAAVRLRRVPAALAADPGAAERHDCPPVDVDYDTSAVSIPAPTFVTKLYESVGKCDDASEAAQDARTFQAIVKEGDEWRGMLPLPESERTSHLCAVGHGCVGDYDGVPAAPPLPPGAVGAEWTPLRMAWPLRVLHVGLLVFLCVSIVVAAILTWLVPQAFNWFPADRIPEPPVELPPDYELMGEVAVALAKMFFAIATLWLLLFVFVVRRSVTPWVAAALLLLPMLLMLVHTAVVVWSMFRKSLYYALFAKGIHLNFPDRKLMFDHWLPFTVAIVLFMYCSGRALWQETETEVSLAARVIVCFLKMSAVLGPLGYSLLLLYQDDQFVWKLRPLHALFARHAGMEMFQEKLSSHDLADTTKFIHNLQPIDEDEFLAAGQKLALGADGASSVSTLVEPEMIMAMQDRDKLPQLSAWEEVTTLKWTIPISYSTNVLRFRIAIFMVLFAGTAVFMILGLMLSYYLHLFPTIAAVEVMHGHLQPAFDPHIFHYTIMVDKHVKGDELGIVPNQDVTTHFRVFDNRALDVLSDAGAPGGVTSVYVPYFRHPDKKSDGAAAEGDDFIAAQEHPVTFYIEAVGAGTQMIYTFTAVKTQTVLTDLTYTYEASGENVTVTRELHKADMLAAAEETDAEAAADDDDTVEVYIPPTTEALDISISKEMVIYGPQAGRRVDPAEFGWLEAGASVHLCPPTQEKCTVDKSDRMRLDALDAGVVAVPVVLSARGGQTRTFTVSLVRVHNRLTNALAKTFAPGREWRDTVLTPPFDPMHMYYQAFFEAPREGGDVFVKLTPAGDPGVNHVVLGLEAPEGVSLVPFCRHPEEYLIAESDAELDCSEDPHALVTRYGGQEFRGHMLIRVEAKKQQALQPFEVKLTVVPESTGGEGEENRTYTFRFLPQRPMQLNVRLPSGAPAVLEPAFRSDVLNYTAVVPPAAPEVTVEMTPTSSFWASTEPDALRTGTAEKAGLLETVALRAPPCDGVLARPTSYPGELPGDAVDRSRATEAAAAEQAEAAGNETAPEVLQDRAAAFCPVEVMAFERRVDFPRVYRVQLLPAAPGTVVFLGAAGAGGLAPLAGFSPLRRAFQTVVPIEGAEPKLVVAPSAGITAFWNGKPLVVTVDGGLASVDLAPVRAQVCACQRLTGCGEKIPGAPVGADLGNGCELTVSAGGEPYSAVIREGATALRLEESVESA